MAIVKEGQSGKDITTLVRVCPTVNLGDRI